MGCFYEKELFLNILRMGFYPVPDVFIRNKVQVLLDLKNNVNKKEFDHAKGFDTSDLACKNM